MKICAELFTDTLKEKDLSFEVHKANDDINVVDFPWQGRNIKCLFSGDKGEYLSMYYMLERTPDDKIADVLVVCNEMNSKYKWVKFYIDNDGDIMLEDDALLTVESAADETFELMIRMIDILKETKPAFMRAIYS